LIEALIRLMATKDELTGPINIGNPVEFTIRDLATQVLQLTGSNSRLVFEPLPMDDPRQRQPDIALARQVLRWEPKIQLAEGLERTIEHFREQLLTQQIAELAALARSEHRQTAPQQTPAETVQDASAMDQTA
jgi:UDP-glucuronate decarboxylase